MHIWSRGVLITIMIAANIPTLFARNLLEGDERFEVDWSSMTIKFYGEAPVPPKGDNAFKQAEQTAWTDALRYAEQAAAKVLAEKAATEKLGERVTSAVRSYNTTYFADGRVRVHLENSLAAALRRDDINFKHKQVPSTAGARNTGLIVEVQGAKEPLAHYQIVDEGGQVLFSVGDIAEDAYKKHLMGRWYKGIKSVKSTSLSGENAARLQSTLLPESGNLQVSRQAWQAAIEGNESVLQAGKISLVIP